MPDVFTAGEEGTHAPLFFTTTGMPMEGEPLVLGIQLGTVDMPIDDFYGIAFTIRYDPAIFSDDFGGGDFSLENDSWIGENNHLIKIDENDEDEGLMHIGITRRDGETVDGFGEIGNFFIVIEDLVVGLNEESIETIIAIENVILMSADLNETTVFADSIPITIFNDDFNATNEKLTRNDVQIYPNPTQTELWIQASSAFLSPLELYDVSGQKVRNIPVNNAVDFNLQIVLPVLPNGIYYLKVRTEKGQGICKISILQE